MAARIGSRLVYSLRCVNTGPPCLVSRSFLPPKLSSLFSDSVCYNRSFLQTMVSSEAAAVKAYLIAIVDDQSPLCEPAIACIKDVESRKKDVKIIYGKSIEQLKQQGESFEKATGAIFVPPGPAKVLGEVCDHLPGLKWIHSWFVGVDSIASIINGKLLDRDVSITNARGAFSGSLSEWVMTICLHFEKSIPRIMNNTQAKNWDCFIIGEVKGKTIGFLGFGDLAKGACRLAKAFGMRTIAVRRDNSKKDHVGLLDDVYLFEDDGLKKVMSEADFVVSVLPGTAATFNLLGKQQFSYMKKSGVFISIGRGTVVVEEELAEVLKSNQIKGAALDVFHKEPLDPSSPLWGLPNVVITAHNADRVAGYHQDSANVFSKNLELFLQGAPEKVAFATPVNKHAGY